MKKRSTILSCLAAVLLAVLMSGQAFAQPYWGGAIQIEAQQNPASDPRVAMDSHGNAIAIWQQGALKSPATSILTSRLAAGGGWEGPQILSALKTASTASLPQIAMDNSGTAIAVWMDTSDTTPRYNVWANRYVPGSGWGAPTQLEIDNPDHSTQTNLHPRIAMDPGGGAIAVWSQSNAGRHSIWANHFSPGVGWSGPRLIESDDTGDALGPQIAIDREGNATAVWTQHDGARYNIWANYYHAASGSWGAATPIESQPDSATVPQVAMDGDGNAMAVWTATDGVRHNIWANRRVRAQGVWSGATMIEDNDWGDAFAPQIAMDGNGNAIAVWMHFNGVSHYWIRANRYTLLGDTGVGVWGDHVVLHALDRPTNAPQLAMDLSGNAIAVWTQANDANGTDLWANQFTPFSDYGAYWVGATLIESGPGTTRHPHVAMNGNGAGKAVAVWTQDTPAGAASKIWANVLSNAPPMPPAPPVPPECNQWVLWSHHRWDWDGGPFGFGAFEVEFHAESATTWGPTNLASCSIPLTVDILEVTIQVWNDDFPQALSRWSANRTAHDTNIVSARGIHGEVGIGGSQSVPCGAESTHRATKNGHSWAALAKSGCRGEGTTAHNKSANSVAAAQAVTPPVTPPATPPGNVPIPALMMIINSILLDD